MTNHESISRAGVGHIDHGCGLDLATVCEKLRTALKAGSHHVMCMHNIWPAISYC